MRFRQLEKKNPVSDKQVTRQTRLRTVKRHPGDAGGDSAALRPWFLFFQSAQRATEDNLHDCSPH